MAFIDEVVSYAHISEPPEEVKPLLDAAEDYICGALEQKSKEENQKKPLYCLAVKMLVSHWYDNRQPIGQGGKLPYGLEAILTQLQNEVTA